MYPYRMEDAEVAVVGLGSAMGTVREVVDELRAQGKKVGMIKQRIFRPFPEEALLEAVGDVPVLGVMEKAASFGSPGGPLYEDVSTAVYGSAKKILIADYIHGLGGRDTSPDMIREIFSGLLSIKKEGRVDQPVNFVGARE
jgi:pyruvate ferredoxin oxidoreductase alpha subunit